LWTCRDTVAYASGKDAAQFREMIATYLLDRDHKTLKAHLLLLIDARHGMKKSDIDFLERRANAYQTAGSGPGRR
jgi:GTP-binding protein EngB required for normal cell division